MHVHCVKIGATVGTVPASLNEETGTVPIVARVEGVEIDLSAGEEVEVEVDDVAAM
jgi:hypothetical protein